LSKDFYKFVFGQLAILSILLQQKGRKLHFLILWLIQRIKPLGKRMQITTESS